MKHIFLLIGIVSLCLTFLLQVSAQTGDTPEDALYNAYKTQKAKIDLEIKISKDQDWAGEYQMSDSFLTVAPESGFAFFARRGFGDYIYNLGNIKLNGNKLSLVSKNPEKWKLFSEFSSAAIPVLWGDRHYLIPEDEMLKFVNTINQGYEPSLKLLSLGNKFYLRTGDNDRQISGVPQIPEPYRVYLLKKPIRAKIITIGDTFDFLDKFGDRQTATAVTLNAGRKNGVREGMEFLTISPSRVHEEVIITKVKSDTAEGKVVRSGEYATTPNLNWKLSTSGRDIE